MNQRPSSCGHRAALARAALLTLLCAGVASAQRPMPQDRQTGVRAVTVENCKTWLQTLTSPEFGGRGTGQDGFRKAADFVAEHFRALGLEPAGDDGTFFQSLKWMRTQPTTATARVVFKNGDRELAVPGERLSGTVSAALAAKGELAIVAADATDAIADAELEGLVVVVVTADDQMPMAAMRAISGKNAAAVLFAMPGAMKTPLDGVAMPTQNRAARGSRLRPTTLAFGGDDRTELLKLAGLDAEKLGDDVHRVAVQCEATVEITTVAAPACNVVGILRGSDAARSGEFVVIGSHLDHLGRRGNRYFPGADDDGSGTTGVLAISTMLAKNATRPPRSVLFVCFCGEEMGLLGSDWFVKHPPIPLESIVAELQMDMIGRDEEEGHDGPRLVNKGETAAENRNSVHLVGTKKLSPELHELCLTTNTTAGFDLEWDQESLFLRSDHANFAEQGVPIAFFFTGLHADYHQVTDTPDKIHYEKLLGIATWVYDLAFELATQADRPRIDPELWAKFEGKAKKQPVAPMLDKGK